MFGNAMDELFAPGRKHTDEEARRLVLSRVDVGDSDPGSGPIDLASGTVTVRPPGRTGPTDPTKSTEPTEMPQPRETPETPDGH